MILFALGGLPGAVFFGAHSLAAYGSLATTGYGDTSTAFTWPACRRRSPTTPAGCPGS